MKRMVTIKDVARAAGVSPSTVSNLLNGRDHLMLPETRGRVEAAMAASGYRPNRAARQLRVGRNPTFGLIVPSVANPFWGSWAAHLETAALRHGRQLYLCNSERDPDRERAYVDQLWADGVEQIVLSTSLPSLDHLRPAMDRGLSVVAFDREEEPDDPDGLFRVSVDNELGACLATRHLLELGHRRIAFLSGAITTVSRRRRYAGYRRALAEVGVPLDERLVWDTPFLGDADSGATGRDAVRQLLAIEQPPTGFVAINDMFAIGAHAAMREAGVEHLAVVGFDDIELAALISPALTTVRQPLVEMAEAVLRFLDRNAQDAERRSIVLPPTLVVRDSSPPAQPAADSATEARS